MKNSFLCVCVLLILFNLSYGQDSTGTNWFEEHFRVWAIQPTQRFFYDIPPDDPTEIDIFKDGKGAFNAQWVGADIYWGSFPNTVGVAVGISTTEHDNATVVILGASGFYQFKKALRIELGVLGGFSFKEGLSFGDATDGAIIVGFGLPFNMFDEIKEEHP